MTELQYGNGEILTYRAVQAADIQFTLRTLSMFSIEDVAAAAGRALRSALRLREAVRLRLGLDGKQSLVNRPLDAGTQWPERTLAIVELSVVTAALEFALRETARRGDSAEHQPSKM